MTYYVKEDFSGSEFGPTTYGPFESRTEAEKFAFPFVGREGWTVEIIEKDEPYNWYDAHDFI